MRDASPGVSVTLNLDRSSVERADELAREAKVSRSAIVRALLASATSATLVVTGGKPRRFKAEVAA